MVLEEFPEPIIGTYYIPDAVEMYNIFRDQTTSSTVISRTIPLPPKESQIIEPEMEDDEKQDPVEGPPEEPPVDQDIGPEYRAVIRRRYLEYAYKAGAIIPSGFQEKLENFVLTSTIDKHPEEEFLGKSWCVIKMQYPPNPEFDMNYITATDYAFVEGYDAVFIEPFELNQLCSQWIMVLEMAYNGFAAFLTASICTTLYCEVGNPSPTLFGVVNALVFSLYKKWVMGDPISKYRNLDMGSNADMIRLFRMTEVFDIHGGFNNVILKDEKGENFRMFVVRTLMLTQMGIAIYKYFLGLGLKLAFPARFMIKRLM